MKLLPLTQQLTELLKLLPLQSDVTVVDGLTGRRYRIMKVLGIGAETMLFVEPELVDDSGR